MTHPEWAGELVLDAEGRMEPGKADRYAVETGLTEVGGSPNCPELLTLAESLGNAKISDIVQTMCHPRSRFSRTTWKQQRAVVDALLARFGTARAVYAAALGISVEALIEAGKAA